jgi:hypothetical protein
MMQIRTKEAVGSVEHDFMELGACRASPSALLNKWLAPFGTDLRVAVRET